MSKAIAASAIHPAPFIVGVGRSGTTLLRLMLDAHPDLAIPGETHFVPALIDVVERTGDRDQALQTLLAAMSWPNLGLEPQAMASAFACQEPFSPGAAIRAVFALYAARLGKPRWGDKTPTYRRSIIEIARAVPEARFIHIIRDGRDVALSYRGLWFGPGDDLDAQARFWTAEITEARRQAVGGRPLHGTALRGPGARAGAGAPPHLRIPGASPSIPPCWPTTSGRPGGSPSTCRPLARKAPARFRGSVSWPSTTVPTPRRDASRIGALAYADDAGGAGGL